MWRIKWFLLNWFYKNFVYDGNGWITWKKFKQSDAYKDAKFHSRTIEIGEKEFDEIKNYKEEKINIVEIQEENENPIKLKITNLYEVTRPQSKILWNQKYGNVDAESLA